MRRPPGTFNEDRTRAGAAAPPLRLCIVNTKRIFSPAHLNHTKSQNAMNAAKAAPKISATSRAALTAAHR